MAICESDGGRKTSVLNFEFIVPKHIKKKSIKKGKEKAPLQSLKGMHDILPDDQLYWEKVRRAAGKIAEAYDFSRIDTPIIESAEVFERTGESTDIVEKQMYFVKARGGDKLVLRPEITAPVMRAYFQHNLSRLGQPVKLFYSGPLFRHEQPQAGRYRQHHQIGFEIIGGEEESYYDALAILIPFRFLEELKIKNLIVHINNIGCRQCRTAYVKKLQEYYGTKKNKICKDCLRRLPIKPLRLLDCKNEDCQPIKAEAPLVIDKLCVSCRKHFKGTIEYLDIASIPYSLNPFLVRGLDYYNRTVFELFSETENFNIAVGGGGRYDYLAEMLYRQKTNGVGGGIGIDRVVELMKQQEITPLLKSGTKIFLIHIGEEAKKRNFAIFEELRKAGIKAIESFGKESLKSQLRAADKAKALLTLIIGQKEVFEESVIIRNMETGNQEAVPVKRVVEEVKKRLH